MYSLKSKRGHHFIGNLCVFFVQADKLMAVVHFKLSVLCRFIILIPIIDAVLGTPAYKAKYMDRPSPSYVPYAIDWLLRGPLHHLSMVGKTYHP